MHRLSDYEYELPDELIAQTPLEDRSASRLLCLSKVNGQVQHRRFSEALELLSPGDLLILNDTRVSALRLEGTKLSGGHVEALLLRGGPLEYEGLLRPGRRLHRGARMRFGDLYAEVVEELPGGQRKIRFEDVPDIRERLQSAGTAPLPPYIHEVLKDPERYQTVYGKSPGSSAAPTAGLHFTDEILRQLREKGVDTAWVTLHVGLDTFRPVQSEDLNEHQMHGEVCSVPMKTVDAVAKCEGRVIAVGTTAVRTLESFADQPKKLRHGEMLSRLFIRPGYRFKIVDGMFTNFHLPRTTMMMMISAMAGRENVLEAYAEAVRERYRFLSFGDSMLIL